MVSHGNTPQFSVKDYPLLPQVPVLTNAVWKDFKFANKI